MEEKSCINSKTGRSFPTDIVNHRLKMAIEVQSGYHDKESKKIVDAFKKQFWINKGYSFYDPDIRDYTVIELIQIFFPNINEIPEYVDFDFSASVDFNLVQQYLNNGYSLKEISNITGYKHIHNLIASKRVILPDNYYKNILNIKPIVMLSKNGDYIQKFNSKCEADRHGFKYGTISRVLFGKPII